MNFSFSDIQKIIEDVSNSNGKSKLKNSFYLLFFIILFGGISWIFVKLAFFESYFTPLASSLNQIGLPEPFFKVITTFIATLIAYFVLIWLISLLRKDLLVKREYEWDIKNGLHDFDFQGNIIIDEKKKAIHIIQSELGCIVRGRNWKNFVMEFDFLIPKTPSFSPEDEEKNQLRRGFGIIYRAEGIGRYYMLKIDITGYLPHVRNILWENNGPIHRSSLNINNLDQWIHAKLSMKDNFLTTETGTDRLCFLIPTHSLAKENTEYPLKSETKPFSRIPFRDSGSVGFRSAPFEEVYIKNLEVKEESTINYVKRKTTDLFIQLQKLL